MIKRIDVIYLHIRDAEKLGTWYNEILGTDIKFKTPDHSWQEFDFHSSPPTRFAIDAIVENDTSPVKQQSIMISLCVNEIDEAVTKLETHGIEFFSTPKIKEEGVSRFATVQDLEGNWLQLSQGMK